MTLEIRNIALRYGDKPWLFQNVTLTVSPGDFIVIRGPSGSGKSSLLRLFNRLQEPTSGQMYCDGKPFDAHEITRLRRRIGYVQQTPVVIEGTVRDNLRLPFTFKTAAGAVPPGDAVLRERLDHYRLQNVHLDERATDLSVGQRQRVALIRTLLVEPDVVLCDEPTSALDEESRGIVERELERINLDRQTAVVLVTHVPFTPERVQPKTFTLTAGGLT